MTTRSWPEKPLPASGSVLAEVLATARLAADADLAVSVNLEIRPEPGSGVPLLTGTLPSWDMVVRAGHAAAKQWMGLRGQNPSDIVVDITPAASHIAASAEKKPRVEIRIGEIPSAVDAVVVGAGICGMMAAYYLARAGLAVAVFDSSYRIGQMTTSWNNGMIHPGHDPDEQCQRRCHELTIALARGERGPRIDSDGQERRAHDLERRANTRPDLERRRALSHENLEPVHERHAARSGRVG